MPGLNGYQATRTLTRDDETKAIPVIVKPPRAGDRQDLGLAAGRSTTWSSPLKPEELLQKIAALPDRHAMARKTSLRGIPGIFSRAAHWVQPKAKGGLLSEFAQATRIGSSTSRTRGIVQMPKLTPVPLTRRSFAGLANIRGTFTR